MDNGTIVEAFKYLNYCQLANTSLVSKRFRDLIQTHRHRLALLYVHSINMNCSFAFSAIKVFDKLLSPEAYNKWVICNNYSKEALFENQVASTQNTQYAPNGYHLNVCANYKGQSHKWEDRTSVFFAYVELNDENWPVLQHFARLFADPFIYIDYVHLTYQNDVLNLLAGAINTDRRLQCEQLTFYLNGNSQKSITWAKYHVRCNQLSVYGEADLYQDEVFLDFSLTGAHCTPAISVRSHEISKVITDFVQKFMDLKTPDEYHFVDAIKGDFKEQAVELFKRDYAEFIVKENRHQYHNRIHEYVFEFVNNDIGKKLQLTLYHRPDYLSHISVIINNL